MFSPSDFNSAVPQFTNGNYANNPLSPLYIEEPGAIDYNRGVEPLQTLPAQWWNWLGNQFTSKLNKLNIYVKNIFDELTQLLSLVGVTPDATEGTITTGQIKDAFETKYPNFLSKFIHTIAEAWSYIGTTVVGDVTTTQTSKLAVFEHVNVSDASTTPATETDTYKTKYVDNLPVTLGGTGATNASDGMYNLVNPLPSIPSNTGLITDTILFERNLLGEQFVKKMSVSELARLISSVSVNVPVVVASSTAITGTNLSVNELVNVSFENNIYGVDTTTPLELTWNGNAVPVKAIKYGSLVDVFAQELDDNGTVVYEYLQANTLVTLFYDGTNLICNGNTVLISDEYSTVYADGMKVSTENMNFTNPLNTVKDEITGNKAMIRDVATGTVHTFTEHKLTVTPANTTIVGGSSALIDLVSDILPSNASVYQVFRNLHAKKLDISLCSRNSFSGLGDTYVTYLNKGVDLFSIQSYSNMNVVTFYLTSQLDGGMSIIFIIQKVNGHWTLQISISAGSSNSSVSYIYEQEYVLYYYVADELIS